MVVLVSHVVLTQFALFAHARARPLAIILLVLGIRARRLIVYRLPPANFARATFELLLNLVFALGRILIPDAQVRRRSVIRKLVFGTAISGFVSARTQSRLLGT
jgi:hypothetical protein